MAREGRYKFDDENCIDAIRLAARRLGKTPNGAEYRAFASASERSLPNHATIRIRFGTWHDALAKAGL